MREEIPDYVDELPIISASPDTVEELRNLIVILKNAVKLKKSVILRSNGIRVLTPQNIIKFMLNCEEINYC